MKPVMRLLLTLRKVRHSILLVSESNTDGKNANHMVYYLLISCLWTNCIMLSLVKQTGVLSGHKVLYQK